MVNSRWFVKYYTQICTF